METPEGKRALYEQTHSTPLMHNAATNRDKDLYAEMLREIEQVTQEIRRRYFEKYGSEIFRSGLTQFDAARIKKELNENE